MRWVVGALVTFKIAGEESNRAFALTEEVTPAQGGPPPHLHTRDHETFYVIEVELEFVVGESTIPASAGSVVHGPRGILHSLRNVGSAPSRMAVIITPAGLEGVFEEVGEPVTDPSSRPRVPRTSRGSRWSPRNTASRYSCPRLKSHTSFALRRRGSHAPPGEVSRRHLLKTVGKSLGTRQSPYHQAYYCSVDERLAGGRRWPDASYPTKLKPGWPTYCRSWLKGLAARRKLGW
jgi:quercetin dioxygenase-like cupin family protein